MSWSDDTDRGWKSNVYVFFGILAGTVLVGGGIATTMDRDRNSGPSSGGSYPPPAYSNPPPRAYQPAPYARPVNAPPRGLAPAPRNNFSVPSNTYSRQLPRYNPGFSQPQRTTPITTFRHGR